LVLPEPHLSDQVTTIKRNLSEPLRIALAGRVSAGKSTTVNALLAAKLAPVGAGETTQVVYRFGLGEIEEALIARRDGTSERVFFRPTGELPEALPVPISEIAHIDVRIPYAPFLREATIIDTPGISSRRRDRSQSTVELLFTAQSRNALAGADALVFLLHGHRDEADALAAFQDIAQGSSATSVNAIGLISQADRLGDSDGPMETAHRIAKRLANEPRLRSRLATVTPIIALLAETIETGALTLEDETALETLANEDPDALDDLLYSADDLLTGKSGVPHAQREQLLRKLGLYGIRVAVGALRAGADRVTLRDTLHAASGFPQLKELIRSLFTRRADPLKADQALTALERLTYQTDATAGARAREQIEDVRLSPPMHAVREIWALGQHAQGLAGELPDWLQTRLLSVTQGTTTGERLGLEPGAGADEIEAAALAGVTACRRYALAGATTNQQRAVVDTVRRSYELMLLGLPRRVDLPNPVAASSHVPPERPPLTPND
jgi:hypothetical protein